MNQYNFATVPRGYIVTPDGDAPPLTPGRYTIQSFDGVVFTFSLFEQEIPNRWRVEPALIPDGTFVVSPVLGSPGNGMPVTHAVCGCGHTWDAHSEGAGACSVCSCNSYHLPCAQETP